RRAQRPRARRRLDADRRAGGGAPRAHDAGGRRAARLRRRGRRPGRRPLAGATRMIELPEGVALSRFTTLGTGGPARWFGRPSTAEELVEMLARDAGLGGLEFASAIPGTAGGGVRMNAGAYGREWRDVLVDAVVADATGVRTLSVEELG